MKRHLCLLATLFALASTSGCDNPRDPESPAGQAASQAHLQRMLAGTWRLTSYIPDEQLSPVMLLSLQTDKILIRFEDGRIQSATASLTMDRAYRLGPVAGNRFKLFIKDESGVEYESDCWFDESGQLNFITSTAPWRGRGSLIREGAAIDSPADVPID